MIEPRSDHVHRRASAGVAGALAAVFLLGIEVAAGSEDPAVAGHEAVWTMVEVDGSRRRVPEWSLSTSGDSIEPVGGRPVPVASEGSFEARVRAIARDGEPSSPAGPHLVLQSGERLPGRPDLVDGTLVWRHAWLGDIAIDPETLRSLVLAAMPMPGSRDADVVTLSNGDRLEGFVTELGSDVVVERLEDGSSQRVPFERIARIDLVEDPRSPAAIRLWSRDGTVVDLEDLRGTRGESDLEPEARLLAFERSGGAGRGRSKGVVFTREVVAVAWSPSRIEPLSAFEFATLPHPDAPDRSWLPSPTTIGVGAPFGASSIRFIGPARFEARVPPGSILSASVELPPLMRRFGDLELRILDGDRERWRRDFSAISPQATIAIPIETGRLAIELGPGLRGPVQDRLRFTLPMLLREPASSE